MKRHVVWTLAAAVVAAVVVGLALSARDAGASVTAQVTPRPAPRMFLDVQGQQQGLIAGEVKQGFHEYDPSVDGKIPVYALGYSVVSPRDAASGLPTGKRQHKPLVVTISWSKATPLLYAALANNENLPEASVTFYEPNKTPAGYRRYGHIKLTNANIASITEVAPAPGPLLESNSRDAASRHYRHMEQVTFTFQKIEWTSDTGGTTAMDDWEAPLAAGAGQ